MTGPGCAWDFSVSRRAFSPFSLALFLGSVPGLWHPAAPGFLIWVLGAALGGRNSLLPPALCVLFVGQTANHSASRRKSVVSLVLFFSNSWDAIISGETLFRLLRFTTEHSIC